MYEVWSQELQELQCYRTRNASQVRLKYTCLYLRSVRIVSSLIFRISTETPSGLFQLFVVFILWFLKTGTLTPLSFRNIQLDPLP